MTYHFDCIISRKGTGSIRWDTVEEKYGEPDLIPLTTADMDFPAAPPIQEAIKRAADFGIFGYTRATTSYYEAVIERFSQKWNWNIQRDWILHSPGVVGAVAYCIQGMTSPGDGVVLPTPMYHPFAHLIEDNGRTILRSPLLQTGERFVLDFASLERQLAHPKAKLMIFCNPHNPIGRAWTYEELHQVCALCLKYGVPLISDEIHCDFVFPGHSFTSAAVPMQKLGGLEHLVVCSSASKSINLAGLQTSNIIIPGEQLRKKFARVLTNQHMMELNMLGPIATEAAYRYCDDWQAQLLAYLDKNRRYIIDFLRSHTPELIPIPPEATYMLWIDCRNLRLSDEDLEALFVHRAKVGLNMGSSFGPEGSGFVRLNFASPLQIISDAMGRIETAITALRSSGFAS